VPIQERGTTRRERAAAVDSRLLDAAIAEIRANGPDDLNLSSVARRARVTTGAIYARYENANELVLNAWNGRCVDPLQQFILDSIATARGDEGATRALRATLIDLPSSIAASLAVLIAAPRVDEFQETVIPEFGGWLRSLREDGTLSNDVLIPVSYVMGAACFDAMVDAPAGDWVSPLSWITAAPISLAASDPIAAIASDEVTDIPFTIATGDATRDALLTGAVSVIARSGLRRSSTSRIARASGHTQSALFQTWKTRRDLVSDLAGHISHSFAEAARPYGSAAVAGDTRSAAQGIARLLTHSAHIQRRARLEFTLAAMYDRDVAERVYEEDQFAVDALARVAPHAVSLVRSIRAVVLGLILLEEVMGELATIDFAPLIQPLLQRARS
jgi:AcrR family transcriptional regulator